MYLVYNLKRDQHITLAFFVGKMSENTKVFKAGEYLYKRSYKEADKLNNTKFNWLTEIECYGSKDTYGSIVYTYKTIKDIVLLRIGSVTERKEIAKALNLKYTDIDCDTQYSGSGPNAQVHWKLAPYLFLNNFDGTYINNETSDFDCEGPTEVVITPWSSYKLVRI